MFENELFIGNIIENTPEGIIGNFFKNALFNDFKSDIKRTF